jgi:hypothetical protein
VTPSAWNYYQYPPVYLARAGDPPCTVTGPHDSTNSR